MTVFHPKLYLALPDNAWLNIASQLPISDAVRLSKSVAKVTRDQIFTDYWNKRAENPKVKRPDRLWKLHPKTLTAFPFEMRWVGRAREDAAQDVFATAVKCQKWEVILDILHSKDRSLLPAQLLWEALGLSIEMGRRDCFDLLIDEAPKERAGELLLKAVESGRTLYAERLLQKFKSIPTSEIEKVVFAAVVSGDCLDLLLTSREDISTQCAGKALCHAAHRGLLTAVRILLRQRRDIPTEYAVRAFQESKGHLPCQKYLLRNREDIPSNQIETELVEASSRNDFSCVEMLLHERRISFTIVDRALGFAIDKDSFGCSQILLNEYRKRRPNDQWVHHVINAAWGGHLSCTLCLMETMSPKQLDQLAGHRNIGSALCHLSHTLPIREAIALRGHKQIAYVFQKAGHDLNEL